MALHEVEISRDHMISYERLDRKYHCATYTVDTAIKIVFRLCCVIKSVDKAHAQNTSSNDSLTRVS